MKGSNLHRRISASKSRRLMKFYELRRQYTKEAKVTGHTSPTRGHHQPVRRSLKLRQRTGKTTCARPRGQNEVTKWPRTTLPNCCTLQARAAAAWSSSALIGLSRMADEFKPFVGHGFVAYADATHSGDDYKGLPSCTCK